MGTILRLYFDPTDHIFPGEYNGSQFFEITDPGYIPRTGDTVYFHTEDFISDTIIAGKMDKVMDNGGFTAQILRIDYSSTLTRVSAMLVCNADFKSLGTEFKNK